ncbi:MAG TPA: DUF1775 domain-containing protein [Polyangiales bacterium]|nr:DUF1775 domain-containing protein [Polyangiales bacterium]
MNKGLSAIIATGLMLVGGTAYAHIEIEGAGTANASNLTTFNVGHGCEGLDTFSVTITIPPNITSVRAVPSGPFVPTVVKDAAGAVTSVKFEKAESSIATGDPNFYPLQVRFKTPDAPFTTVYFPTTQVCRDAAGTNVKTTDWVATTPSATEDGPEPAPALFLLPAHSAGWNKFTVPVALTDLSVFDDAQIVWAGNAVYSSNATTKDLIGKEPNTTALTTIAAGTEIWVKY